MKAGRKLRLLVEGETSCSDRPVKEASLCVCSKELSLCTQAYGMFTFNEETRTYWFSSASMEAGSEFRLVGQLMGLAIFNSVILDAHFPHCLYLKLLGKKPGFNVSPQAQKSLRQ